MELRRCLKAPRGTEKVLERGRVGGEQCEGVKPVENTGTGKEIFKRRVVGPPK